MRFDHDVWILEDDPDISFIYKSTFELRYNVRFFGSLAELSPALSQDTPRDLLIADLRLPDGSFLNFIKDSKNAATIRCPFIVVSSISDIDILRSSFERGAHDYLIKPFQVSELIVKTERQLGHLRTQTVIAKKYRLEMESRSLRTEEGVRVELTPKELHLMAFLFRKPNGTATREEIVSQLWPNARVSRRTIDVHLFNLRKKLRQLGLDVVVVPTAIFKLIMQSDELGES